MVEWRFPAMASLSSPEDRLTFLNQQMSAIALAMTQAQARGDTTDLANLRALLRNVIQDARTLGGEVSQAEAPSQFLQALASFSDQASTVLAQAGGGLLGVIGELPVLVIGLLIALGIGLYKGSLTVRR